MLRPTYHLPIGFDQSLTRNARQLSRHNKALQTYTAKTKMFPGYKHVQVEITEKNFAPAKWLSNMGNSRWKAFLEVCFTLIF